MITPCIKVCRLDPKLEYCTGCWRSREEIQDWTTYTNEQRQQIVDNLTHRWAKLAGIVFNG